MSPIVIAGFGSAGYAALTAIKKLNPKTSIIVIDPKQHDIVHPCGLPYSLEGIIDEEKLHQDIELSRMNVKRIQSSLTRIDTQKKICTTQSVNGAQELPYEKLILTLGFKPFIPSISGINEHLGKTFFTLHSIENMSAIKAKFKVSKSGIVIGGGAIGLESAVAMKRYIHKVLLLEMKDQILSGILDKDMSQMIEDYLIGEGVEIHTGSSVQSVIGDKVVTVKTADGQSFESDLGILASGFIANDEVAKISGIQCTNNGIAVNRFLETSFSDIFAAGDCISGWSVIDGKPIHARLATSAFKQGIVAARNAMGERTEYRGSAATFVTKIGTLEIAGTGYTTENAQISGYTPVQGKISSGIFPEYYPDDSQITIKVLCDSSTGKLLGAQAVGKKGAAERINIISLAIEFGLTIDDLQKVELAYCPAVSEVYDPLLRAADFGMRKRKIK